MRIPWRFAVAATCSDQLRDASVSIASGDVITTATLMRAAAASSSTCVTACSGVAMIARSTGAPIARNEGNERCPSTEAWRGFTAYVGPLNPPASMFSKTTRPSDPSRAEAPTSATEPGLRSGRRA